MISYDLNSMGQDYPSVTKAIQSLGSWARVQKSVWYVESAFNAESAAHKIYASMDANDSLIVIDASSNEAFWYGVSDEVGQHLQAHWSK